MDLFKRCFVSFFKFCCCENCNYKFWDMHLGESLYSPRWGKLIYGFLLKGFRAEELALMETVDFY